MDNLMKGFIDIVDNIKKRKQKHKHKTRGARKWCCATRQTGSSADRECELREVRLRRANSSFQLHQDTEPATTTDYASVAMDQLSESFKSRAPLYIPTEAPTMDVQR